MVCTATIVLSPNGMLWRISFVPGSGSSTSCASLTVTYKGLRIGMAPRAAFGNAQSAPRVFARLAGDGLAEVVPPDGVPPDVPPPDTVGGASGDDGGPADDGPCATTASAA